uniref:Pyrroline-5-carboxylate reductase n=1 Tax=Candidatus Kentrum sp. MB TaxID=2138164 RepID=A0A450X7R3_9GAMM|nr:MAG: pyrroline-5-carboxylate reductase [Candidatus Kentron sp. MB]VFK29190.1 MAG: pyrroline-5-carboxylate reductase [Candidatus Kentron sp. MB]VFK74711.1 MAG: pyrroline-5-carboxylate reductase [Candidatus Kentron sp. MB]
MKQQMLCEACLSTKKRYRIGISTITSDTTNMSNRIITFIGGGNMAASLIGGITDTGHDPKHLWVSEPDASRRTALQNRFGIQTTESNVHAALQSDHQADIVVFSVKPQCMRQVVMELADTIKTHRPLVVSVAAGIREPDIRRWLGFDAAIVRAMPNTPALVRSGATALYANPQVSRNQRDQAESLLQAVGVTLWVDAESHMDTVTALSGSGPAYFFLVMEIIETVGRNLGLSQESARLLTLETAFGAAKMALESSEQLHTLRTRVTSPGGTTERALTVLDQGNIAELFDHAIRAAHDRSVELGHQFGDDNG